MRSDALKKRIILDKIRGKFQDDPFRSDTEWTVRLFENDFIDEGIPFDEVGSLLVEIEQESRGDVAMVNAVGKMKRRVPPEVLHELATEGGPEGLSEFENVQYYEVRYRSGGGRQYQRMKNEPEDIEIVMHLSKNNELYRSVDGRRLSYAPPPEGIRSKIVRALAESTEFVPTAEIADAIGTSARNVQKEVGEIRVQIAKQLELEGDKIIIGKQKAGYRFACKVVIDRK